MGWTRRGGKPVMDPTACVGCHLCVLVCPVHTVNGCARNAWGGEAPLIHRPERRKPLEGAVH
ncbi:4Fe-4S binding protein [Intestinimonas aquisgranensis]|nr:4Fe-4S binding protein [Intestinimonas aquisgranensis]